MNPDAQQPYPEKPIRQLEPIAAIATPVGQGAISIVRISGEGVLDIGDKVFSKMGDQAFSFSQAASHTAHVGQLHDRRNNIIDQVVAVVYRAPRSYTSEDSIEINCHGGVIVTETVLQTLLEVGCRLAQPGEFTRRAFLNGRIDLVQAEAIGEMIHAKTEAAYRSAMVQLKGDLSKKLGHLRQSLLEGCALLELELDFSEEDVEFQDRAQFMANLKDMLAELVALEESFKLGKLVREGISTAIIGRPNAGKSTLLNALLGKDRAIVSHVPGTTRDYIEESFVLEGLLFRLVDTAGLRKADDAIETEGIKRSFEKIREADLILYVHDAQTALSELEIHEIRAIRERAPHARFRLLLNKTDKPEAWDPGNTLGLDEGIGIVAISAKTQVGFGELKAQMKSLGSGMEKLQEGSALITNQRHAEAIRLAIERLRVAEDLAAAGAETELITSDLREALHQIGGIIGEVSTDDILNHIFEKFCIGK
jgi:tRNA modification GTPase